MIKRITYCLLICFICILNANAQSGFRNKISLNAYSFNALLKQNLEDPSKGMSLFDLLDLCKQNNFDAVDLTGYYFPGYPHPPADSFIYSIKKKVFELGIEISGTGVRNDFANIDPLKRVADIKHVKEWIDVAAKLGAPVIRIFSGTITKGYENKRDSIAVYMANDIRQCAEYGKQRGVIVGIQNHDDFLKTSEEISKLLKLINHDWVGVVLDIGSFPTVNPYKDIEAVLPCAVNFQFKEYVKTSKGQQKTDIEKVLKIIKNNNYRGYLPIETLPNPANKNKIYDPLKSVPQFLKQIKTKINRL